MPLSGPFTQSVALFQDSNNVGILALLSFSVIFQRERLNMFVQRRGHSRREFGLRDAGEGEDGRGGFCRCPLGSTLSLRPDLANRSAFQPTKSTKSAVIRALLSTNQMLDPLDLGTFKSANHRAETTINQSDAGSAGSLNVNGSGSKPNLSNCQNSLAVHLGD